MRLGALILFYQFYLRLASEQTGEPYFYSKDRLRLLPQVQLTNQLSIPIGFCLAQIIEQTPALGDHFEQAATRGVIFAVGLKVFGQMLNPAGEKCNLHIRTARIFIMQLELLEVQRFRALCHLETPTLNEEPTLATDTLSWSAGTNAAPFPRPRDLEQLKSPLGAPVYGRPP
jgi:hypothetical protein